METCDRQAAARQAALQPTRAVSYELRAHLAACDACQADFDSTRELVDRLTLALAPEPLPLRLTQRIDAGLAARVHRPRRRLRAVLPLASAAIAAGLLAAILIPSQFHSRRAAPAQTDLNPADAAAIVAAVTRYVWDSPLDYSFDLLLARVRDVSLTLEDRNVSSQVLPWTSADDWDWPPDPGS